jgi:hypothetical protein
MAAKVINGHTHIRLVKSCSMMRGQLRAISFLVKHSSKHTIPRDPSDGGRRRRRRRRRRCNAAAAPKSATAKRTAARSPSGPWTTPGRSGGATDGPALSGGALPRRHSSASNGQPAVDPVHASIQRPGFASNTLSPPLQMENQSLRAKYITGAVDVAKWIRFC